MRRADDAEVDLERRQCPRLFRTISIRKEIDAEAADHAVRGQDPTDARPRLLQLDTIRVVRGKTAPQIDLTRRPSENLIVGRDQHDVTAGAGAELRARRVLLRGIDEFLDDAAHRVELVEIRARRLIWCADRHVLQRLVDRVAARRLGEREHRVSFAGEAVVQLDDGAADTRPHVRADR